MLWYSHAHLGMIWRDATHIIPKWTFMHRISASAMGKEPTPSPSSNYDETSCRSRPNLEEGVGSPPASSVVFPRRIVGQLQEEQPFIRTERPQFQLRRLIASLDETRIFHLFDVFVVLLPLQCVEG